MTKAARSPKRGVPKAAPERSNALNVYAESETSRAKALVQTVLRPSVRAAVTTQTFSKHFGELDINALVEQLASHAKTATNGDLQRPEAMLVAQAHTLEAIFHELARRSALNMGEYLDAAETYMRLALKAQGQCRATIETLAEMKNPKPVAFVQQANISNGPQQVNNPAPTPADGASRVRESENPQNKLLELMDGERLDFLAPKTASGVNSRLEAMGPINGAADHGRKGQSCK
jgi:hypothetical protein